MMKRETFESSLGESYVKAVCSSGVTVYVLEKPLYKSTFAIYGTKYGSIDNCFAVNGGTPKKVPDGIAHYLEHKLFESEDGDAFQKFAKTGASANAFTSFDRTCYLFNCADNVYENLSVLLDFVAHPYFTEETVKKEQGIIGQEIKMYDDSPSWRVTFNMLENMYHNHPVKIDIAGTVESIAKINADLLYDCYNTFYNPSNMFVCVVGNVDTEKVLQMCEKGIISKEKIEIERIFEDEPETVMKNYVEQNLSVSIPMFSLGFKQKITSPYRRLKSKICVAMLLEIICGECSPLYAELMNEGLINDEFSTEYFNGYDYACTIFSGESGNPKLVAEKIKSEIKKLRENGIDKKMFSAIKCGMFGDLVRRFDSVQGLCMQLAESAVYDYNLFDEIKVLKQITCDDVYKRLDIFDDDLSVLSVINPLEK
ncbi:MAG: insulinase family protein [Clostridia bacterium]|nr:insulinase family protein [Clostridia bacterium]